MSIRSISYFSLLNHNPTCKQEVQFSKSASLCCSVMFRKITISLSTNSRKAWHSHNQTIDKNHVRFLRLPLACAGWRCFDVFSEFDDGARHLLPFSAGCFFGLFLLRRLAARLSFFRRLSTTLYSPLGGTRWSRNITLRSFCNNIFDIFRSMTPYFR